MTVRTSSTRLTLRKRFGAWLKERREAAGLTQMDVARRLDFDYWTMVSQIERGKSVLPAHDMKLWAETLRIEPQEFGTEFMYYNEPNLFALVHGVDPHELEGLAPTRPTIRRRTSRASLTTAS